MNKINRMLVGLELKNEDLKLIKYVKSLAEVVKPTIIDFVHIAETFEIDLPEIGKFTPQDEKLEQIMRDEVSLYFKDTDFNTHFEVVEGKPVEQLLHWSAIKQSDLIILGRKTDKVHNEITLEKIVRKSPCSVLIVPNDSRIAFDKFLFPVDYSDKTLEGINIINDVFHTPKIEGLHYFELPSGYYKTGKTAEEFTHILDNNCKKEAENLIKKLVNTDNLSFKNICSDTINEYESIIEIGIKNKNDIIAIGSRGRTNTAAILLGSFAEKFIRHNRSIPTLVIKEKGENMDFLKAFLKL